MVCGYFKVAAIHVHFLYATLCDKADSVPRLEKKIFPSGTMGEKRADTELRNFTMKQIWNTHVFQILWPVKNLQASQTSNGISFM